MAPKFGKYILKGITTENIEDTRKTEKKKKKKKKKRRKVKEYLKIILRYFLQFYIVISNEQHRFSMENWIRKISQNYHKEKSSLT